MAVLSTSPPVTSLRRLDTTVFVSYCYYRAQSAPPPHNTQHTELLWRGGLLRDFDCNFLQWTQFHKTIRLADIQMGLDLDNLVY